MPIIKEADDVPSKEDIILFLQQENLRLKQKNIELEAELKRLRDGVNDLIDEFKEYEVRIEYGYS